MAVLHFKSSGKGEPLIILHGLFGMLDNWQTIANRLDNRYLVYLVDLRNHGRSPHMESMTYPEMAEDIVQLMDAEGIPAANILGHSMGGKVAMQLAFDHPLRVQKLIVADIGPKGYPPGHDQIFEALDAVVLPAVTQRRDAEEMMQQVLHDPGIILFLMKNLQRHTDGSYGWRMNLEVIREQYSSIRGPVSGESFHDPALFIRGSRSDYIPENDWPAIQELFPLAALVTIPDAGHWVHADQPDMLLNEVVRFLLS